MATSALDFSTPHVLRTVREYNFLTVLIAAYEDEHVPEPREVSPQEVI
jgi:hypothetical protein